MLASPANGLFGRQGVLLLRLSLLQLGLIEAADFPHVGLACHFLKTIREVPLPDRGPGAPTRVAPAKDLFFLISISGLQHTKSAHALFDSHLNISLF